MFTVAGTHFCFLYRTSHGIKALLLPLSLDTSLLDQVLPSFLEPDFWNWIIHT